MVYEEGRGQDVSHFASLAESTSSLRRRRRRRRSYVTKQIRGEDVVSFGLAAPEVPRRTRGPTIARIIGRYTSLTLSLCFSSSWFHEFT